MKKVILIVMLIFLSGCIEKSSQKNDLIVEFDYPKEVVYGSSFLIKINLKNNLENELNNVFVSINNLGVLNLVNVYSCSGQKIENGCFISKMDPGDEGYVSFFLNLPNKIYIPGSFEIIKTKFSISYDYKGQSVLLIPIYGDEYKGDKKNIQFTSNDGPIKILMNLDNEISDNNYVISGDLLSLKFSIIDSGSSNSIIKKEDVSIELNGFNVYQNGGYKECELKGEKILTFEDDIKLPSQTFTCILEADKLDKNSWEYGTIIADYKYNYVMVKEIEINTK